MQRAFFFSFSIRFERVVWWCQRRIDVSYCYCSFQKFASEMSASKVTMVLDNGEKLKIPKSVLLASGHLKDFGRKANLENIRVPKQWTKEDVQLLISFLNLMEEDFERELQSNNWEQNDF
ncbi:hypothetical protein M3Y95_00985200 [Aphelenchoides besseyi]|nr:hypothetical protein M3Y95_00985200 [Aphelenchoides besseyi]